MQRSWDANKHNVLKEQWRGQNDQNIAKGGGEAGDEM